MNESILEEFDNELKSQYSYLRYTYVPRKNIFYLNNIGTIKIEDRNKGYAKELLFLFFDIIKNKNGVLDPGFYTVAGEAYIKPIIERLSKEYNIKLVNIPRQYD